MWSSKQKTDAEGTLAEEPKWIPKGKGKAKPVAKAKGKDGKVVAALAACGGGGDYGTSTGTWQPVNVFSETAPDGE